VVGLYEERSTGERFLGGPSDTKNVIAGSHFQKPDQIVISGMFEGFRSAQNLAKYVIQGVLAENLAKYVIQGVLAENLAKYVTQGVRAENLTKYVIQGVLAENLAKYVIQGVLAENLTKYVIQGVLAENLAKHVLTLQNLVFYSTFLSVSKTPMDFSRFICFLGAVLGPPLSEPQNLRFHTKT
jgi:hypothetical protein